MGIDAVAHRVRPWLVRRRRCRRQRRQRGRHDGRRRDDGERRYVGERRHHRHRRYDRRRGDDGGRGDNGRRWSRRHDRHGRLHRGSGGASAGRGGTGGGATAGGAGSSAGGGATGTGGGTCGAGTSAAFPSVSDYTARDGGFGPVAATRNTGDTTLGTDRVAVFRPAAAKYGRAVSDIRLSFGATATRTPSTSGRGSSGVWQRTASSSLRPNRRRCRQHT